jgi:hypothetical protein
MYCPQQRIYHFIPKYPLTAAQRINFCDAILPKCESMNGVANAANKNQTANGVGHQYN